MNTQSSTPVLENLTGFTFRIHDVPESIDAFTWSGSDECKRTFLAKWKEALTVLQNEDVLNKKQPAKELHILYDMQGMLETRKFDATKSFEEVYQEVIDLSDGKYDKLYYGTNS